MSKSRERRTEQRLLCAELVQMTWMDDKGIERYTIANLEDISLSGMCLQVERFIPRGARISVRYGPDGKLAGTVRHAAHRDSAVFLGVQIEDGCRWSSTRFRPRHLLDPSSLVENTLKRYGSNVKVTVH